MSLDSAFKFEEDIALAAGIKRLKLVNQKQIHTNIIAKAFRIGRSDLQRRNNIDDVKHFHSCRDFPFNCFPLPKPDKRCSNRS